MRSIYQLTKEAKELASLLSENELNKGIELDLTINQEAIQKKSIDYAYVVKSFESDIDTIDSEIKRLQALKSVRTNAITRMKEAVLDAMEVYGIEKVETPTLKLLIRKNPESVDLVNEYQIPDKYRKEKVVVSIDKVAIKKDLKDGIEVEGALLKQSTRLEIK